ncbi:unnamed protein product [Sphagnum tenellum]
MSGKGGMPNRTAVTAPAVAAGSSLLQAVTGGSAVTAAASTITQRVTGGSGNGHGGGSIPQVKAAMPTIQPVDQNAKKVDEPSVTLQQVNDLMNGKPNPNPLNSFWQVAYHWRLFILNDRDLFTLTGKQNSVNDLYTAIEGLNKVTICETGATNYNIKSVEMRGLVGSNPETRNVHAFKFNMTVVEPISVGFLDALKSAALQMQVDNLQKCPYYLELSFRAYDEATGAIDINPLANAGLEASKWIWAIQIIDIDTHFDAAGGTYNLSMQIYNDSSIETDILTMPQSLTMQGGTIGDVLKDLGQNMTKAWSMYYGNNLVTYDFQMHQIINPPASIGNPDPNTYRMQYQNKDWSSVRTYPQDGSNAVRAQVPPGTSFNDIVDWIAGNNEQTHNLGLDRDNAITQTDASQTHTNDRQMKEAIVFRIEPDVEITGYDYISANYIKKVHIHIWPYYTQAVLTGHVQRDDAKDPNVQARMVQQLISRGFLAKHYDYLYTGLNTEVLDFEIKSSFKWNALLPKLEGARSRGENYAAQAKIPKDNRNEKGNIDEVVDLNNPAALQKAITSLSTLQQQYQSNLQDIAQQITPLSSEIVNQTAIRDNPKSTAAEIQAAQVKIASDTQQVNSLTDQQQKTTTAATSVNDRANLYGQRLKALANKTVTNTPAGFAEDLINADGTIVASASAYQYEQFNYAISFRQGNKEAENQAGTGFSGAYHRDRSTFGALIDQLYQPYTVQLAKIEITVRGDPYWIGASNLSRQVLLRAGNQDAGTQQAMKGLPNWVSGDQVLLLTFQYPILVNDNFEPVFKSNDTFDGIYRVTEVQSTFADGVFKQKLTGLIIPLINIREAFSALSGQTSTAAVSGTQKTAQSGSPNPTPTPAKVSAALTSAQQQQNATAFKAALLAQAKAQGVSLTDAQVDGIVANAYRESSMQVNVQQIGGSGAGLLQWTGPSRTAFTTAMGVDPSQATIDQQAQYTIMNLKGSEHDALAALQQTATPQDAAQSFLKRYERPSPANQAAGTSRNNSFLGNLYGTGPV